MYPDLRYPKEGYWEAGSSRNPYVLAKDIYRIMCDRGVKVRPDFHGVPLKGYDVKLDIGDSVSILFLEDGAGSTLKIRLFDKGKERDLFLILWQFLINRGDVFDELFRKEPAKKLKLPPTLTEEKVNEIEERINKGEMIWEVASAIGVSDSTIKRALRVLRMEGRISK